jgi:hypothetical protein
MPILIILWCNDSLVTWFVSLTTAKFKPLIFSGSGFALSYAANMVILMILYDLCLLSAQFFYITEYIWKVWKPYANGGQVCTLENFKWCGESCFEGAAILRGESLLQIPMRGKHKSLVTYQCFMKG